MLKLGRISTLAVGAALLLAGTSGAMAQDAGRLEGKPNLNGIWTALSGANWDLEPHSAADASPVASRELGAIAARPAGVGVVEGGVIPYLPEALAKRDANKALGPKADPEAACYLPGIPRATYIGMPFQFIQSGAGDILVAYEYASANRVIYVKDVEVPPIDTWMGTSYGSWEGDTLKVVTLGQNGESWLDRAGNFLTASSSVTERFTRKGADHIDYVATIEDPSLYSRPWKISMTLYRRVEANAQLMEFKCVPFSELHLYGDLLETKAAPKE
jgi:hypothetical protein